jgi:hypothetical protein
MTIDVAPKGAFCAPLGDVVTVTVTPFTLDVGWSAR